MNIDFHDPGLMDYKECWDYQESLFNLNIQARKDQKPTHNHLIFVEHPHVYTLGKSGKSNNLLISDEWLKKINATYYAINRGGDITYHGPGQIVGYPIFDLESLGLGLRSYIHCLEQAIIETMAEFGLETSRFEGATGVWLDVDNKRARKICAIGVRASRMITMHGFALNVNTDLKYFSYINPCGFVDKGVTSLERELGRKVDVEEVKEILKERFKKVFKIDLVAE